MQPSNPIAQSFINDNFACDMILAKNGSDTSTWQTSLGKRGTWRASCLYLAALLYVVMLFPASNKFIPGAFGAGVSHYNHPTVHTDQVLPRLASNVILDLVNTSATALAKVSPSVWPICTHPTSTLLIGLFTILLPDTASPDTGQKQTDLIYPFHYFW